MTAAIRVGRFDLTDVGSSAALRPDPFAIFQTKLYFVGATLMSDTEALQPNRIVVGTRFKMSQLGAARCPSLAGKTGIVVGVSRRTTAVTILFDDGDRPTCLHRDFVTPI
jgi:hypothetical protein